MSFTIIPDSDMSQGSDAWLEWREDLYTASEAAVIMKSAPSWEKHVKTWDDLRKVHMGLSPEPDKFTQYAWDHGKKSEPKVRAQHYPKYKPACIKVNNSNFAASLDGIYQGLISCTWLEIKCPTPTTGTRSKAWKKAGLWLEVETENRDIRECFEDHHWWQLVHQAMVLPLAFEFCHFVVWLNEDQSRHVTVDAKRLRQDTDELYKQWLAFENEEDRRVDIMDPQFVKACDTYLSVDQKIKVLEKQKEAAKTTIKKHIHGHEFAAHGLKATSTKGRINWKTACMALYVGEDMEKWGEEYRGANYVEIRMLKGNKK